MDIIRAVRNIRSERGVEPSRRIAGTFATGEMHELLEAQSTWIASLARFDPARMTLAAKLDSPPNDAVPLVIGGVEIYLPLAGMFDVEAERTRLEYELGEVSRQISRLTTLLDGAFSERAPAEVVEKERSRLGDLRVSKEKLTAQLNAL
jgi:valyl-tRNA synthetase